MTRVAIKVYCFVSDAVCCVLKDLFEPAMGCALSRLMSVVLSDAL